MKSIYFKLSIQVVLIFLTMIFISFVPDYLHPLFGDEHCFGNINNQVCSDGITNYSHGKTWHWGYRHYLWTIMGSILFIIQLVRVIKLIDNSNK